MIRTTVLTESGKRLYESVAINEKVFVLQEHEPTCVECEFFIQHYAKLDTGISGFLTPLGVGHCTKKSRTRKFISRSATVCECFCTGIAVVLKKEV